MQRMSLSKFCKIYGASYYDMLNYCQVACYRIVEAVNAGARSEFGMKMLLLSCAIRISDRLS